MTLVSQSAVTLEMPERYLGQLVKHFGHRMPTTLDGDRGSITFPFGTCLLAAEGSTLRLRVEVPDEDDLGRIEGVIKDHLERFTFKTKPDIVWVRDPA